MWMTVKKLSFSLFFDGKFHYSLIQIIDLCQRQNALSAAAWNVKK
jgi:hypothetical protein